MKFCCKRRADEFGEGHDAFSKSSRTRVASRKGWLPPDCMISLRHLLKGSVLATTDQVVRAVAALVVTPVMVAHLGTADFGLWVLLTVLFSHFILLDPGLQSSLPRFLVQTDEDRLRAVASTAQRMYGIAAASALALTALVWALMPWFVADVSRLDAARRVAFLLGTANAVGLVLKLPSLHLQSLLRRDVIAAVSIGRVLVCSVLVLVLLSQRGGGLIEVALVHCGGVVAEACALAWFGRELLPCIRGRWVDREMVRTLLGYSKWAYLISNCERLRAGLDGFVLGWLRGSAAAGIYSLGARPVSMAFDTVYACIGTQLLPAFTKLRHHGDQARLGAVFVTITRLSAWLSLATAGVILVIGPSFLKWWVPLLAADATPVLLCLALPCALQVAQVPAVHLLYAVAEHRSLALVQTVGLLLNLALSVLFARWIGIVGAALGTAVEILLLHGLVMPMLIARKAAIAPGAFLWKAQIVPLLVCAAVFAVPALAAWRLMPFLPSVVHLAMATGLIGAWLGSCAWIFRIGRAEMAELRRLLA